MDTPFAVASQFNACIGARDLDSLSSVITDDHVFIDTAGTQISGKAAVLDAWRSFFSAFPDYRNEFTGFVERNSEVCIEGHSSCTDPRLSGPALWRAVIRRGLLVEWRVFEDTPGNRATLGMRERTT